MTPNKLYLLLISILFTTSFKLCVAGELIEVNSRDDVLQRGLFIESENATHTVLLFPGGGGWVKLKDDGELRRMKGNFVVRTRDMLIDAEMNVVIVDSPTDNYSPWGMSGGFRSSAEHMADITALIKKVKEISPKPIWLSGTSRGSESVAYAGIHVKGVDGIILTSSITEHNEKGETVTSYALNKITIPVFVGAHKDDECWVTPPEGAAKIRSKLINAKAIAYKIYTGGDEPITGACKAKSEHGFYGIEHKVLSDMIDFIKNH